MKIYKQKASGYTAEVDEGFNGWTFLFGPLWYLYKGMIGRAILTFFGMFILVLVLNWIGGIIGWIVMGATANRSYEDYLISRGYTIVKPIKKTEENESELKWECEYCGKEFNIKKEAESHEKQCSKRKN